MNHLLELPPELLTRILLNLSLVDISSCYDTGNTILRQLIRGSVALAYHIQLEMSGMEEDLDPTPLPILDRLTSLLERERHWLNLHPIHDNVFKLPPYSLIRGSVALTYHIQLEMSGMEEDLDPTPFPILDRLTSLLERERHWLTLHPIGCNVFKLPSHSVHFYSILSNAILVCDSGDDQGARLPTTVRCLWPVGPGHPMDNWRVVHQGDPVVDVTAAPEENLLAIATLSRQPGVQLTQLNLEFRHLSDGLPHANAAQPIIQVHTLPGHSGPGHLAPGAGRPEVYIEILGSTALIVYNFFDSDNDVEWRHKLHIYDWRTGILRNIPLGCDSSIAVTFLREDLLLLPDIEANQLRILAIPTSPAAGTSSFPTLSLQDGALALSLPPLKPTAGIREEDFALRSEPLGIARTSQFVSRADAGIVLFSYSTAQLLVDPRDAMREHILVISRSALLAAYDATLPSDRSAVLPWAAWGPACARFFTPSTLPGVTGNSMAASGSRLIFKSFNPPGPNPDPDADEFRGHPIRMLDFSPATIAKLRARNVFGSGPPNDTLDAIGKSSLVGMSGTLPDLLVADECVLDTGALVRIVGPTSKSAPTPSDDLSPSEARNSSPFIDPPIESALEYAEITSAALYDFHAIHIANTMVVGLWYSQQQAGTGAVVVLLASWSHNHLRPGVLLYGGTFTPHLGFFCGKKSKLLISARARNFLFLTSMSPKTRAQILATSPPSEVKALVEGISRPDCTQKDLENALLFLKSSALRPHKLLLLEAAREHIFSASRLPTQVNAESLTGIGRAWSMLQVVSAEKLLGYAEDDAAVALWLDLWPWLQFIDEHASELPFLSPHSSVREREMDKVFLFLASALVMGEPGGDHRRIGFVQDPRVGLSEPLGLRRLIRAWREVHLIASQERSRDVYLTILTVLGMNWFPEDKKEAVRAGAGGSDDDVARLVMRDLIVGLELLKTTADTSDHPVDDKKAGSVIFRFLTGFSNTYEPPPTGKGEHIDLKPPSFWSSLCAQNYVAVVSEYILVYAVRAPTDLTGHFRDLMERRPLLTLMIIFNTAPGHLLIPQGLRRGLLEALLRLHADHTTTQPQRLLEWIFPTKLVRASMLRAMRGALPEPLMFAASSQEFRRSSLFPYWTALETILNERLPLLKRYERGETPALRMCDNEEVAVFCLDAQSWLTKDNSAPALAPSLKSSPVPDALQPRTALSYASRTTGKPVGTKAAALPSEHCMSVTRGDCGRRSLFSGVRSQRPPPANAYVEDVRRSQTAAGQTPPARASSFPPNPLAAAEAIAAFIPERKHVCLSYDRRPSYLVPGAILETIIDIDPLRAHSVAYQAALPEHGTRVWAKGSLLPGPPRVLELLPMSRSTGPRGGAGYAPSTGYHGYEQYGRAQTPAPASSGYAEYTWPPPMPNDPYAQQRPQTAIGFRSTSQAPSTIDPRYLQNAPMRSHTPGPGAYQAYYPPPPVPVPPVPMPYAQAGPGLHYGLYHASDMGTGSQSQQRAPDAQPTPIRPAATKRTSRREGNFIISTDNPSASGLTTPPDMCPTCFNPAPTAWRFGKVSERMVCQPCSLYERRNGIKRTPEVEAQKVLRALAGGRR
uniref:GATA-type domain-containing protein n=1 Tax=Mycena chlorophos TaxID=658473 RepID=A0ABQ0LDK4_MYCCL|nr:predicted protein [Mycena chlorophos]